jgi:hypothetical protein
MSGYDASDPDARRMLNACWLTQGPRPLQRARGFAHLLRSGVVQEGKTPAWGEAGVNRQMGEGLGLGHAIRRRSPTNALQAILFRSHARLFRSEGLRGSVRNAAMALRWTPPG